MSSPFITKPVTVSALVASVSRRILKHTAMLLATSSPAWAMYCTPLGSGGLVIGHYQPLQAVPLEAQTTFAIECFPSTPGESLNLKVRLQNAGSGRLQLLNTQAGNQDAGTLAIDIYRDAARSMPLDEQSVITFHDLPVVPTRYLVSLFARVPARQDAGTGQYLLPLTVIIDY
jgi:spore coat protein U-like protein